MNILPSEPVDAMQWAYQSWDCATYDGQAVTIPVSALRALLDAYIEARAALELDVRQVLADAAGQRGGIGSAESHY